MQHPPNKEITRACYFINPCHARSAMKNPYSTSDSGYIFEDISVLVSVSWLSLFLLRRRNPQSPMSIVGIPTPSPTAILMISLVERPEEDFEDEVLLPPVLLLVPISPPLLLLDGELDDAVCVVVMRPL